MWTKLIIIAFLCAGTTDTMFKLVIESGLGHASNTYILLYNCLAFGLAFFFCRRRNIKPNRKEISAGAGTGLCIASTTIFSMKALAELPGIICFPALSAGNLFLVTVMSRLFWKEKFSRRQIAGLMLAATAIVLIVI